MWCSPCGQDVPGLASAEDGKYHCPRCGKGLPCAAASPPALVAADPIGRIEAAGLDLRTDPGQPRPGRQPSPPSDGWEIDAQLRHIERLLGNGKLPSDYGPMAVGGRPVIRVDAAHRLPADRHYRPARQPRPAERGGRGGWSILTWTSLSLGMTVLVCGAVLLGWSVASGRKELWATGMPVTFGGLGGLLLGLVVQLDRFWHDNRQAASRLDRPDVQLRGPGTTTSLLGAAHRSPGAAFYAHVAEGAHPQLLLADLKSQLDLLAAKLGQGGK